MQYIRVPFADSGDKTDVPVEQQSDNSVSFTQGYPLAYSLDPETDPSARRIERDKMNDIFWVITKAIQEIQQTGTAPFITAADNGGTAFTYPKGAHVYYNGAVYRSLVNNNQLVPGATGSETRWEDVAGNLKLANRLKEIADAGTAAQQAARSNLGLGSAATRAVGSSAGNIPDMGFFGLSAVQNGYTKLPNGFMLQWGSTAFTTSGQGSFINNFSANFPTAALTVYGVDTGSTGGQAVPVSCTIISTSQFRIARPLYSLNSSGSIVQTPTTSVFWLAIGY